MPRKPLIRSSEFPYHVTARCNNKEPFPVPLLEVWNVFEQQIQRIVERFGCKIHAFVLMPNHFHLLITVPNQDLGMVMQSFMVLVTQKLNSKSGRTGRIFGARYHWSLIDHEQYFDCALKYIYRNPVKARLVERVEAYRFSTIHSVMRGYFDKFELKPPIGHQQLIPNEDATRFMIWLNQAFRSEEESAIKGGLRRLVFDPSKINRKIEKLDRFAPMNKTR